MGNIFPEEKSKILKSVIELARKNAHSKYDNKNCPVFVKTGCVFSDQYQRELVDFFRQNSLYQKVVEYDKIDEGEFIWLCERVFFHVFKTEFDNIYMKEHNIVIEHKQNFKVL